MIRRLLTAYVITEQGPQGLAKHTTKLAASVYLCISVCASRSLEGFCWAQIYIFSQSCTNYITRNIV